MWGSRSRSQGVSGNVARDRRLPRDRAYGGVGWLGYVINFFWKLRGGLVDCSRLAWRPVVVKIWPNPWGPLRKRPPSAQKGVVCAMHTTHGLSLTPLVETRGTISTPLGVGLGGLAFTTSPSRSILPCSHSTSLLLPTLPIPPIPPLLLPYLPPACPLHTRHACPSSLTPRRSLSLTLSPPLTFGEFASPTHHSLSNPLNSLGTDLLGSP